MFGWHRHNWQTIERGSRDVFTVYFWTGDQIQKDSMAFWIERCIGPQGCGKERGWKRTVGRRRRRMDPSAIRELVDMKTINWTGHEIRSR